MKEIYKAVKGYEGLYEVSNLGNVKSLARKFSPTDLILKPCPDKDGYLMVGLSKYRKTRTLKIHQLVAIAFLDHAPDGMRLVVNHIDLNKANNNLSNLEIVTQRENSNQKHINSSSKYVGVSWCKRDKKWASKIKVNNKTIFLGRFHCEIEAHEAYQNKLKEISK